MNTNLNIILALLLTLIVLLVNLFGINKLSRNDKLNQKKIEDIEKIVTENKRLIEENRKLISINADLLKTRK